MQARRKPFGHHKSPDYLMEMAAVFHLLPRLPARVLDVGCGTGWTSVFLARRGYDVVGVDIAPDMIRLAEERREFDQVQNLEFQVSDYESMPFEAEFDAALFYDALHHAENEEAALRAVFRALKPGGVCICSEPGTGHSHSAESVQAMAKYGVTEKDMPPRHIIAVARKVGFRGGKVYPHAYTVGRLLYASPSPVLPGLIARCGWIRNLLSPLLLGVLQTVLIGSRRPGRFDPITFLMRPVFAPGSAATCRGSPCRRRCPGTTATTRAGRASPAQSGRSVPPPLAGRPWPVAAR